LTRRDFSLRAFEKSFQRQQKSRWIYLSFATGFAFLGAAIVRGHGFLTAIQRASDLNINPGGGVMSRALNWRHMKRIPANLRDRLLSGEDVAGAQPVIYPVITAYPADGSAGHQVTAGSPAKVGDTLVIYCLGLGATNPEPPEGQAAPGNPLDYTSNAVQVGIGSQTVHSRWRALPARARLDPGNSDVHGGCWSDREGHRARRPAMA
jgi:hypothetical protein